MEDYSINISVRKKSNISSETAETVNFHFSHYKTMGTISCHRNQIIMKSLDPLRAKKIFIRTKLGHTAVSAIKASSVTLYTWQKEPVENTVNLQVLTWQSFQRLI